MRKRKGTQPREALTIGYSHVTSGLKFFCRVPKAEFTSALRAEFKVYN
jgi:hypothetical protein